MALGWTSHRIATEAGLQHRNHVWRIIHGQKGKPTSWIQRDTDKWVREVYERLCMTLPTDRYAKRTRAHAARKGWAPPLAWDDIDDPAERPAGRYNERRHHDDIDPAVVDRLLAGKPTRSTRAERDEAMRRWKAMGRPERALCEALGWKDGRYGKGEVA
jgi:hypothetical protein